MKLKKKVKIYIATVIFCVSVIGITYSITNIGIWTYSVKKNAVIITELKKEIIVNDAKTIINFDNLKSKNSDTVAYLKVPGTNIDYIVLKGKDNSYYLKHNFNKEYNIAGWVFADYHNSVDGTDKNLIIYGHNTKDNSMFGSLKNILTDNYYDYASKEITFITEKGTYTYEVFSTYEVKPEEYYINTKFASDTEYVDFLNTISNRSRYAYDKNLDKDSKILTLSSCKGSGEKRIVLHAVLTGLEEK